MFWIFLHLPSKVGVSRGREGYRHLSPALLSAISKGMRLRNSCSGGNGLSIQGKMDDPGYLGFSDRVTFGKVVMGV